MACTARREAKPGGKRRAHIHFSITSWGVGCGNFNRAAHWAYMQQGTLDELFRCAVRLNVADKHALLSVKKSVLL